MKIRLLCFLLSLGLVADAGPSARLSPLTRKYLHMLKMNEVELPRGYVYKHITGSYSHISALLKVGANMNPEAVSSLGVRIGTRAGQVWTAQIPVDKVTAVAALEGIEYLQLDEPVHPTLDSARIATRTDSVHAGLGGLPSAFHGDGVVMGVIDIGFDYRHPTLFDTTGSNYRVNRIWEQQGSGTPPSGYAYGHEMTVAADMWTKGYDMTGSHGAHVGGIAAGSGNGSNGKYRGIAPASEIVLVSITPPPSDWTSTGMSDIIDGASYIFNYAASQGKAAVVNLSWGCSIGPHDGYSLFSQALDNLTGPGKIFVCSAGNNGDQNLHLQKTFSSSSQEIHSFFSFNTFLPEKKTWIDIWGDTAKSFCMQLSLFAAGSKVDSTGFICLDNQLHLDTLTGTDNESMFVAITTSDEEFNGKPRIFLDVHNKSVDAVLLTVTGQDGSVHIWSGFVEHSTGYYGNFISGGNPWATSGNNNMTIGDMASSRSALAVGAYISRNSYTNVAGGFVNYSAYGTRGALAPFSSRGPSADGRTKPDINAPGMVVGSAVNSYDPDFATNGDSYGSVVHNWTDPGNSRTYSYAMLMGTSMSSPVAAGVVALMLQANPTLTPEQVQQIIAETAIKDAFTGNLPTQGNNLWGHGKLNALRAVHRAYILAGLPGIEGYDDWFGVFPNPAQDQFAVSYLTNGKEAVRVAVTDLTGRVLYQHSAKTAAGEQQLSISTEGWSSGVYLVRVSAGGRQQTAKLVVR